ncbi:receptor protein-tyrosine kinase CEPR2-like [Macadamia integrifolia]|uniref:receptor protein-tyrosine kinase CEPR2-like n=1 Tax=Macadamia integrifolia TaxID=60698 RepID=UPI001C502003|nr:receptor protein-tyrosine kinase CEPR2-like [Macadamia integrifolia]
MEQSRSKILRQNGGRESVGNFIKKESKYSSCEMTIMPFSSFGMNRYRLSLHFLTALLLLLIFLLFPPSNALTVEIQSLLQFKNQLKDPSNSLANWKESDSPCNFTGVYCDPLSGRVTGISLENISLSGEISPAISGLQSLNSLFLPSNSISGELPFQLINCSSLRVLNLTGNDMNGTLPDLSPLRSLEILDLSFNYFSGRFPNWVGKLTNLDSLGLGQNGFDEGEIPESLGNLKNLTWLYLAGANLRGQIPQSIFRLKALETLDFSSNSISGEIPKAISNLQLLNKIELFSNNFTGDIPPELSKLTLLREFDISKNQMSGEVPAEIGNLKNLVVFQLYENYFTGELPAGIGDLQHLESFSIYRNNFSGVFPVNFGRFSPLKSIDISENKFSGQFPRFLCESKMLQFLLALDNNFSGDFPESYAECKTLERFRVSKNRLSGMIANGIWGLPSAKIIDFGDNNFTGGLSLDIGISASLNQLLLQNNNFSGELPLQLGNLSQLEKLSASYNSFSGEIPSQIGDLKQLSSLHLEENSLSGPIPSELGQCAGLVDLNLAGNTLSGNIPETFATLNSLNSLNLSQNKLSGLIPHDLEKLKLSSIDFSKNQLSGRVPFDLFVMGGDQSFLENYNLCIDQKLRDEARSLISVCSVKKSTNKITEKKLALFCIIVSALVVIFAGVLFVSHRKHESYLKNLEKGQEKDPNWKLESFHPTQLNADEICSLEEENLIGSGSTGRVYRLDLKNGGTFAVKQLWKGKHVKALKAEMEILGKIRHKNILKLYACLMRGGSSFLVYEYMENGNLFQALHRQIKGGKPELNWDRRYKIALGAAKAIAYLHHDCAPPIIHRDIKSTNILLAEDYEPKIADFGIAKVVEESGIDSSCFAGTHGYIAPELAYSLKVTEKSDVYSFGVVLLELVTGRSPFEAEYGEWKDIVYWVSCHLNDREDIHEVFDRRVSDSAKAEMIKVLRIAILCTTKLPSLRPTMRDVVKMLIDADPCSISPGYKAPEQY